MPRAKTNSDSCLLISTTLSIPRFLGTIHVYTAITETNSHGETSHQKVTLNPAPSDWNADWPPNMNAVRPRGHVRSPTFPLYHSTRKKPRRWPLVLRFIKGAIHVDIALPVILHAVWAAFIVYIDQVREDHIGLPNSIIPSLSIVVGLMLVFRNQTSYDRFWQVCRSSRALEPFDKG